MSIKKNIVRNTRSQIIKTARKLFSQYTYLGASMDDIAKKLRITKAALYHYFSGKEEIYNEVLNDAFDSLKKSLLAAYNENNSIKRLHKVIINYLDFGLKEKNLINFFTFKLSLTNLRVKKKIIEIKKQIINLVKPVVEEVMNEKLKEKKVSAEIVTIMLISMMNGLILEYSTLNKQLNTKKISEQIITVLFRV
ncbi:TetR/AcrR family transcriptional regulator [Deferribacter abyssi]|uniref:TetR/AcrR family transcriptional regulator n=1 Tax=Deferribacter abyssi TaxID=213806 RepID=UPI003C1BD6AA